MKTQVIMKRELFGVEISQQSKTEFFSATELVKAGNKWRVEQGLPTFNITSWWNNKDTKEFISELEKEYNVVFSKGRGKGKHTWVHPLLFIDIAITISPKMKIEVYEWLFDNLIKFRNYSRDSYKKMCGALFVRTKNKRSFDANIKKLAKLIKEKCKVDDWQTATEEQLNHRDKIHDNIAWFADVMKNNKKAIAMALSR